MDKTAIKNFSIWARNKLIADITYKTGLLGITEEGIKDALPQSTQDAEFYDIGTKEPYAIHGEEMKQRKELVSVIQKKASQLEYKDAYRNVIEEVAYTWFNRLIAIRFMEVNDYMPAHIRVLSSESIPSKDGWTKLEPDLVTTPFDAEIEFTQQETEHIMQMKNDNQVDALFRFLFIKQCNALNAYLPKLFEKTSDYTELLLNVSVTDQDGIVYHLTHDIKEDDFNISNIGEDGKPTGQVEIIGWMYQYYNTEPKDEVFALLKSNVKITKERIPAATQLFTPDWIVRYMVENSVGRLWLEGHENEILKRGWKYYLDEAEQEAEVEEQLKAIREEYKNIKPEEIKVIDPCMGSGHILVYAFDVLMQIYESYGYSQRDAAKSIVENNIYGLDIDDRAFQLAYFAIMMKARSYNRRFLTHGIEPNLCAIQESNGIQYDKYIGDFLLSEEHRETLRYLLHTFVDAKEYGSILNVEKRDYDGFLKAWELTAEQTVSNVVMLLWYNEWNQVVPVLAKQAKILSQKYDVVVTNPPYMASSGMNQNLIEVVRNNFQEYKNDLFACFIKKSCQLLKQNRYIGLMTSYTWMFLTAFTNMRKDLLQNNYISSLIQPEYHAFFNEAFVPICTFVVGNLNINYKGTYIRLEQFTGAEEQKKRVLEAVKNRNCDYLYSITRELLKKIPDCPIAYWLKPSTVDLFTQGTLLSNYAELKQGLITGNNDRFLRFWQECDRHKITTSKNKCNKWFFYHKGGEYRKWYGNISLVVNWEDDGFEIVNFKDEKGKQRSRPQNVRYYLKEGFTWTALTIADFNVRYMPEGAIFDAKGSSGFMSSSDDLNYIIGLCNSKVAMEFLAFLAPTMDYNAGSVCKIPCIYDAKNKAIINGLVSACIEIARNDWDFFETSWDFKIHPFIIMDKKSFDCDNIIITKISESFYLWKTYTDIAFEKLKYNEEELNRIFIDIYGLQDELTSEVEDKNVTVRKADLGRDIRSFISYAVGCMLGRYSLDQEGLMFAGGDMKDTYAYCGGTFTDTANIQLDGKYTFGELGTPFYYLPVEGKEPLECWKVVADNIIPITSEEYFTDDIVNRFVEFVKIVYGAETLEENLDFIAQALGNKGDSSREVIRNYFLKDFYVDHLKVYQKRPIYWLFDSGKQNGFKALIYMHRYNANTIGNLRVDYLHRMERIYESEINRMQDTIDNSSNAREVTTASKRKEKLQKQLKECQEYDEKVGHLALSRIEIDLDDGVKVNYEKVQTARDGKKYQVLAKI